MICYSDFIKDCGGPKIFFQVGSEVYILPTCEQSFSWQAFIYRSKNYLQGAFVTYQARGSHAQSL